MGALGAHARDLFILRYSPLTFRPATSMVERDVLLASQRPGSSASPRTNRLSPNRPLCFNDLPPSTCPRRCRKFQIHLGRVSAACYTANSLLMRASISSRLRANRVVEF